MAKWLNCADLDFGDPMPRLSMRTVHRYIRSLNVKVTDVMGIAAVFETRNQIVRLTFTSQAICSKFLNDFAGVRNVTLEDREITVTIKDSNEEEKFVRIAGLPHEMDLRIIQRRLKEFGKVFDLRWERYHVVEDEFLYPVLSAWLICRMVIDKDIPSYLTIGSYRTIVKYHGQKQTCRICDETNHMGRDCPTLRKNRMVVPAPSPLNPSTGSKEAAANPQVPIVEAKETDSSEKEMPATSAETIDLDGIKETDSMEVTESQVIPETQIQQDSQVENDSTQSSQLNFSPISLENENKQAVEGSGPVRSEGSTVSYLQRVKQTTKPNTNPTTNNQPTKPTTTTAKQTGGKTSQPSSSSAEPPAKKKST